MNFQVSKKMIQENPYVCGFGLLLYAFFESRCEKVEDGYIVKPCDKTAASHTFGWDRNRVNRYCTYLRKKGFLKKIPLSTSEHLVFWNSVKSRSDLEHFQYLSADWTETDFSEDGIMSIVPPQYASPNAISSYLTIEPHPDKELDGADYLFLAYLQDAVRSNQMSDEEGNAFAIINSRALQLLFNGDDTGVIWRKLIREGLVFVPKTKYSLDAKPVSLKPWREQNSQKESSHSVEPQPDGQDSALPHMAFQVSKKMIQEHLTVYRSSLLLYAFFESHCEKANGYYIVRTSDKSAAATAFGWREGSIRQYCKDLQRAGVLKEIADNYAHLFPWNDKEKPFGESELARRLTLHKLNPVVSDDGIVSVVSTQYALPNAISPYLTIEPQADKEMDGTDYLFNAYLQDAVQSNEIWDADGNTFTIVDPLVMSVLFPFGNTEEIWHRLSKQRSVFVRSTGYSSNERAISLEPWTTSHSRKKASSQPRSAALKKKEGIVTLSIRQAQYLLALAKLCENSMSPIAEELDESFDFEVQCSDIVKNLKDKLNVLGACGVELPHDTREVLHLLVDAL